MRVSSVVWSLVSAVVLAACSGSPQTGDQQNLTEKKIVRFDVKGAAVGVPGSESEARASWQTACDAWVLKMTAISGAEQIEGHDCGTPVDNGTSNYQFRSEPVIHVAAKLTKGDAPDAFEPGPISGTAGTLPDAITSWQTQCDQALDGLKVIYGSRLLAGTCALPSDIGQQTYQSQSKLVLWIAPAHGTAVTADGYVFGANAKTDLALTTWRNGCNAWIAELSARSGGEHLERFSCGTATDVGKGDFLYTSNPSATFLLQLHADTSPTKSDLDAVTGSEGATRLDALASWRDACRASLDSAKTSAGERFLVGSCAQPKDIGNGNYQFTGAANVLVGDLAEAPLADGAGGASLGAGGAGGGGVSLPPDSPPAWSCDTRCAALLDKCDVGPVDSTCAAVCFLATEAKLTCAEATCDVQQWDTQCHLFGS